MTSIGGPIVDLFGGPGGWDEGLRLIGIEGVLGVEYEPAACATRAAAGHSTWPGDVAALDPHQLAAFCAWLGAPVWGLIASPPCPAFSAAGKRGGIDDIALICAHIRVCAAARDWVPLPDVEWSDPSSRLTLEPVRWYYALRPAWVACEQVPAVLPIWQEFTRLLEQDGMSTWTGELCAADYGVPQTRTRAILMASRETAVHPPTATHAEDPHPSLFGDEEQRWVTMAQALGWGRQKPAWTLAPGVGPRSGSESAMIGGSGTRDVLNAERENGEWVPEGALVGFPRRDEDNPDEYRDRDLRSIDEPSSVVTEKARSWSVFPDGTNVRTGQRTGQSKTKVKTDSYDYRRDIDEPAPTLTTRADLWQIEPGTDETCPDCGHAEHVHDEGSFCAHCNDHCPPLAPPAGTVLRPGSTGTGGTEGIGNRRHYGPDEPAPTVAFGHDAAGWQWIDPGEGATLNTGRAWEKGGSRDDAQKIAADDNPAPALTSKSGGQWIVEMRRGGERITEGVDPFEEPAPTITTRADRWQLNDHAEAAEGPAMRAGGAARSPVIDGDTDQLPLGAEWTETRPATTVAGDPRVARPGHKANADSPDSTGRMEGAIKITPPQALVLQSFRHDYPVAGGRTVQFQQIGNAVPPRLAAFVAAVLTGREPPA